MISLAITTLINKIQQNFNDLIFNIEQYNPQQEIQQQKQLNTEIDDETVPIINESKMYNSNIHEQIVQQYNESEKQNYEDVQKNENQIEEIIDIYSSKVHKSPIKSSRTKEGLDELSPKSKHQKLLEMQKEKQKIQEHLRRLNQEMNVIKKEQNSSKINRKKIDISRDTDAAENAHRMLMRIQKQRKEIQERKNKEQLKFLQQLEKQTTEKQIKRRQNIERMKQQKREAIAKKLEDKKREKQSKRLIEKQSNLLIKQLKKSESLAKDNSLSALAQKKKSLYMKRNYSQKGQESGSRYTDESASKNIIKHQKFRQSNQKTQQSSYPKPLVHYRKGKFMQILEQQQKKKKQEQKQKQEAKRLALQKRKKYGQLINNLFVPTTQPSNLVESRKKPPTPGAPINPKIRSSLPRRTQQQLYNRNAKSKEIRKQPSENGSQITAEQKQRIQQQRELKLKQIRKQTQLRLKRAQQKQQQLIYSSRNVTKTNKYSNYLKQLPKSKVPSQKWKKILEDQNLTKQQKYNEMISQVNNMESKARINEKYYKQDGESMNLIIGSIQAKLALLDQL